MILCYRVLIHLLEKKTDCKFYNKSLRRCKDCNDGIKLDDIVKLHNSGLL